MKHHFLIVTITRQPEWFLIADISNILSCVYFDTLKVMEGNRERKGIKTRTMKVLFAAIFILAEAEIKGQVMKAAREQEGLLLSVFLLFVFQFHFGSFHFRSSHFWSCLCSIIYISHCLIFNTKKLRYS